jgi:hypothetical protein
MKVEERGVHCKKYDSSQGYFNITQSKENIHMSNIF